MEDITSKKTPEVKARLKAERKERRKTKKIEARATKRGVPVDVLKQEDLTRELEEARKLSPAPNRKKRSREDDDQKVQCSNPSSGHFPTLPRPSNGSFLEFSP